MKVLAIALALCFAAAPVQAAAKKNNTKIHGAKHAKGKSHSHVKHSTKASKLTKRNRSRAV
jgi:hypothetical protein